MQCDVANSSRTWLHVLSRVFTPKTVVMAEFLEEFLFSIIS